MSGGVGRAATTLPWAVAAALLIGCGGGQRLEDLEVPARLRLVACAGHHLIVSGETDATEVLAIAADGAIVARTRLAPESFAVVDANAVAVIDRLGGRVRSRRHGDDVPRWQWPTRGKAVDFSLRDQDVLALDDAGRVCLLRSGDGVELDCVILGGAAGVERDGMRLLGGGRIGGQPWAWLRGQSSIIAVALRSEGCGGKSCVPRHDAVAWTFGYGPELPTPQLLGDALWLQPVEGVIELRDGRTGQLRRSELAPRLGRVWPVADVLLVAGLRDDGVPMLAALDANSGDLRWQRRWRDTLLPTRAVTGPGILRLFATDSDETVIRASDGGLLGELPATRVSVANEESWLGQLADGRLLASPLATRDRPEMPAPPRMPAWLRDGTELHYVVRWPNEPPRRVTLRLQEFAKSGARVQFPGPGGASLTQLWTVDALESGRGLCLLPRQGDPEASRCPAVLVGRATAQSLVKGQTEAIDWPGAPTLGTTYAGPGLHAAGLRLGDSEATQLHLLPSLRMRASQGEGVLEVGAWPDAPLLLYLERGALKITFVGAATLPAT